MSTGESLGFGITCIDSLYVRPGLACFYLMEQGGECAVIETGTSHSIAALESVMHQRGLSPAQVRYVIPTHVHLDHAGGAGSMMQRFPNARLLVHPRGARHMIDPQRLIESSVEVYGAERFHRLYGEILPIPAERVLALEDGQSVSLGGRVLQMRHTAGHANHHFCIWDEVSRGWFSGDMFGISYQWCRFEEGDFVLPATTPTQFDPQAYCESLRLLDEYQPERVFLTHYGELAYSSEKSTLLQRQVAAYSELAPRFAGDKSGLERALVDYSLGQLRKFSTGRTEAELRRELAFDMDLNAQGLQVWLQRSARGDGAA